MGAKEEAFNTGQMAGLLVGFALPPFIQGITITTEIRLLEGTTSSWNQESGHDVSAFLVVLKNDYLVHFLPRHTSFNLFYFLGLSFGLETASAKRATTTGTEKDSGTAVWFVIDTGLGAWVNLGGPVDLLLRLEFNLVPVSKNVGFFVVGTAGIQVKF